MDDDERSVYNADAVCLVLSCCGYWQVKKVKKHRTSDAASGPDPANHFQQFQNFKNMEKDAVSCLFVLISVIFSLIALNGHHHHHEAKRSAVAFLLRFVAKTSGLLPAAERRSLIFLCPGRSDGSR